MNTRHRLFGYFLMLRKPCASELDDIDAAYAWMLDKGLLLIGGYVLILALTVVPAFTQPRDFPYRVVALLGTHLMLWGIATSIAACWIGFRVRGWGQLKRARASEAAVTLLAVLLIGAILMFFSHDATWEAAFRGWLRDTFGSVWWYLGLFVILVYVVPDVVARLRRREMTAVTRALSAEAASEKLARKTAESELRLLQAQVEPHFLYNTLANLRYLIQKNSPDALRMTDALIEYLRTSVPDIRAARVSLGREIDHARHYLEIMHMRMGSRLAFIIDVPETLRATQVPPLLLLTLVENAVKHGIAPQVEGGEVVLRAREVDAAIEVEVADTGVGIPAPGSRSTEAPSTGVGLENLRSRLQLAYGRPVGVELVPNAPRGTRVEIRLPKELPHPEAAAAGAQVQVGSVETARSAGLLAPDGHGGGR
jgi:signal transduction histidine kinase